MKGTCNGVGGKSAELLVFESEGDGFSFGKINDGMVLDSQG